MSTPRTRLASTVLGTSDPRGLAAFYGALLSWKTVEQSADWVQIKPDVGGAGLAFQLEDGHVPPAWPGNPGDQQMQIHLDIGVHDLAAGEALALSLGASIAADQPQSDVRVLLDPAGHPFCLFQD